jgi:hypothetical protein
MTARTSRTAGNIFFFLNNISFARVSTFSLAHNYIWINISLTRKFYSTQILNHALLLLSRGPQLNCGLHGPSTDGVIASVADPDPIIRGTAPDPAPDSAPNTDPYIIKQKELKKTLIPTVLLLFYDFLSLKNDVNGHSKSNKQKTLKKYIIFVAMLKVSDKNSRSLDPNPNP